MTTEKIAEPGSYTVVIPAWNAQSTIAEALASVWGQTRPPVRVIVVDDGSTDATVAAVRAAGLPVDILSQANAGPGAATTAGIAAVSTPYLATLDADDLWLPDKIERQFAFLGTCTGTALAFGHWQAFSGDPANRVAAPLPGWTRTTLFARTDVVRSVGPVIDPPGFAGDMIDWLARAREAGHSLSMHPDVVALRRMRPGSLSDRNNPLRDKGYLDVARRAILRRKRSEDL